MPILLHDLDLLNAERLLCQEALERAGTIVEVAKLLGITRHALKRRLLKHQIEWPIKRPVDPLE
jgi:DNA-binding NtrC family response regulator